MELSGQLHTPATLPAGVMVPGTHWIGGWVGPRGGLDAVEKRKLLKLSGFEPRPSSPSLYWLSYSGPYNVHQALH
jgi:hypothetical protein